MSSNPLYMIEFVVDDLVITKINECAPDEYPTVVEMTFRSSVFICINESDFGQCLGGVDKSGKCCLFALDKPVTEKENLIIHVYKKKNKKCKFLIGMTEMSVKQIFEKVSAQYKQIEAYGSPIPSNNSKKSAGTIISEQIKNLSYIENEINSPNNLVCNNNREERQVLPVSQVIKKFLTLVDNIGKQVGGIIITMRLSCMGPAVVSPFLLDNNPKNKDSNNHGNNSSDCSNSSSGYYQRDTCCGLGEDDYEECKEEERKNKKKKLYPCFQAPTKKIRPDAYDEFEAELNGSGIIVRVLKETHKVNSIIEFDDCNENGNDCKPKGKNEQTNPCCGPKVGAFVGNQLKKYMGGNVTNAPGIPVIHGNLKYPENNECGEDFSIPYQHIECNEGDVDKYRKKRPKFESNCVQVNSTEIDNMMKGLNKRNRQGLEICKKAVTDEDTDVFILKLGKKPNARDKRNVIEIELKTPKDPCIERTQKITREAQVEEDLFLVSTCTPAKGGKGGKGAGKKK